MSGSLTSVESSYEYTIYVIFARIGMEGCLLEKGLEEG